MVVHGVLYFHWLLTQSLSHCVEISHIRVYPLESFKHKRTGWLFLFRIFIINNSNKFQLLGIYWPVKFDNSKIITTIVQTATILSTTLALTLGYLCRNLKNDTNLLSMLNIITINVYYVGWIIRTAAAKWKFSDIQKICTL